MKKRPLHSESNEKASDEKHISRPGSSSTPTMVPLVSTMGIAPGMVGLVQLNELRKMKQQIQEDQEKGVLKGASESKPTEKPKRSTDRKTKKIARGRLSFQDEEEEKESDNSKPTSASGSVEDAIKISDKSLKASKRIKRDPTVDTSFLKDPKEEKEEQQLRERLRQQFLQEQARMKKEEVTFKFVYYDGTNYPGQVTVPKGSPIWVVLDKTRKERKEFHRGTVDDIMLVINNIIIPHNYDLYYFIVNKVETKQGILFDFDNVTKESIERTRVVYRPWYERNKHLYPASQWKDYDPEIDYVNYVERDKEGNAIFNQN